MVLPRYSGASQGRRAKVGLRLGFWNVGSLTGKSFELVKILQRRMVDIACIQETKWKGKKAREIDGWKLWYSGASNSKNGVGILVDNKLKDKVVQVVRTSDRLMLVKMVLEGDTLNVISAYAPHVGLSVEEKRHFWEDLDGLMRSIPETEKVLIGGDFNGHIGKEREGYDEVHGGFGFGERNDSGRAMLEFSVVFGCVIANSWFNKRDEHLVTFQSAQGKTQIDYFLLRRRDKRSCRDCKVIPFGGLTAQHRLLVLDLVWFRRRKRTVSQKL